jgi:hypothetical protein
MVLQQPFAFGHFMPKITTKTIRQFILEDYMKIDVYPEGQRLDTEPKLEGTSKPSKAQGIIYGFMCGLFGGSFILNQTPHGAYFKQIIDAGHRTRYLRAFISGDFREFYTGKFFREFDQEFQTAFLNININIVTYHDLTPEEIAFIFQLVNKTTDVNHQEMLNSYNCIPVAKHIRETARVVTGIENNCHPLFESYTTAKGKLTYTNLMFGNERLRLDEMVARLYFRFFDGGGLGVMDRKNLEDMYNAAPDNDTMIKLSKQVKKTLDFVLDMAYVAGEKRKLTIREFSLYSRLFIHLTSRLGAFSYNRREFFNAIDNAFAPFRVKLESQTEELQERSPFDAGKTVGQQVVDSLGEYDTLEHVAYPIKQILMRADLTKAIIALDPARLFTREERIAKLIEQGNVCAIDGLPLTLSEAEGAHIIAHSIGGRTVYDNLAMVRACYNKQMGSISVTDFISLRAA